MRTHAKMVNASFDLVGCNDPILGRVVDDVKFDKSRLRLVSLAEKFPQKYCQQKVKLSK
jgi:hypothetical protein